jgi:hypothetical protein
MVLKIMVTLPISKIPEVGAGVVFPNGFHRVERRAKKPEGKVYLFAMGEPFELEQCQLPDVGDRLSDWFGQCPLCKQNASDYVPRQQGVGGFAFCEPCGSTWKPDFSNHQN